MKIHLEDRLMVRSFAPYVLSILVIVLGMAYGEPLPEWQLPANVQATAFELGEGKSEKGKGEPAPSRTSPGWQGVPPAREFRFGEGRCWQGRHW